MQVFRQERVPLIQTRAEIELPTLSGRDGDNQELVNGHRSAPFASLPLFSARLDQRTFLLRSSGNQLKAFPPTSDDFGLSLYGKTALLQDSVTV